MTLYSIIQENLILLMIGLMILFFALLALGVMYIVNRFNEQQDDRMDYQNETITDQQMLLAELQELVMQEQNKLHQLKHQTLQPELERALVLFEQSNIRIPSDILEDAATRQFQTDIQAVKFIENQRYVWKQENMKKLYKG